jgi:hypothetical protein
MQLLVTQQYLLEKTTLSSDLDFALITPIMEDVQFLKIKPLLGNNLYNLILTQSTPAETLTTANRTLLDEYILPCAIRFILSDLVMPLKFRYENIGIVSNNSANSTPIETTDVPKLVDYWKNKAEEYGQAMQNFIKANPTDYPTYFDNTGLDEIQPSQNAFNIDVYIPGLCSDGKERI